MRASEQSPRMFESDFFDFFSRTPWWGVPLVYVPVILALLIYAFVAGAAWWLMPLQFALGWVLWSLTEYWLHRTLFHWAPKEGWGARFHFLIHGVHHDWFQDKYRLVMPPAASSSLSLIFFSGYAGICYLLSPWLGTTWVFALFAGKLSGYMYYDLMHYYLHHGRPKSAWIKGLRAHHNNHHHANHDRKFGVSMMLWDRIFGTM